MASGISIDSGSEFNGIEFISSPDDIPELFIDVILLPEQFNEIKNQVSEHSSLGVSVGLMCFAKQSFNIPSKLFPDEIFLYDVGKHGIDRACITEFINVTNTPTPPSIPEEDAIETLLERIASTIEDIENIQQFSTGEAISTIKNHAHSADHGIWKIKELIELSAKGTAYPIIQTILLGIIAWRVF